MRNDILLREHEIREWCNDGLSKIEMCVRLNCQYTTLNRYLDKMHIDYSGCQNWALGRQFPSKQLTYEEYVAKGGKERGRLKQILFRQGLKVRQCECCGLDMWQGKPIPLELHHKDGCQSNVSLNNLQILCPNCHALTLNYASKKLKVIHTCPVCGHRISHRGLKCKRCAAVERASLKGIKRPSMKSLLDILKQTQNFCEIGRMYDVSDNAVRKWCDYYNIPTKKILLREYLINAQV